MNKIDNMYYQVDVCCLCLNNQTEGSCHLREYNEKLNTALPNLSFNNKYDDYMLCVKCCEVIDFVYEFNNTCISNRNIFLSYNTPLSSPNRKRCKLHVKLSDFGSTLPDNQQKIKLRKTTLQRNHEHKYSDNHQRRKKQQSNSSFEKINSNINSDLNSENTSSILSNNSEKGDELNNEFTHTFGSTHEEADRGSSIQKNVILNDIRNETDDTEIKIEDIDAEIEDPDNVSTYLQEDSKARSVRNTCYVVTGKSKRGKSKESCSNGVATHNKKKVHNCNICNKSFAQAGNLTSHKRVHTGVKPYKCDMCNKGFTQSSILKRHKQTHTGEKPCVCLVCNKRFTEMGFAFHRLIHLGVKPHVCEVCNKGFRSSSHLARHKFTHTGEKPYKCVICNRGFGSSSNLVAHTGTHTREKPYKCVECYKAFGTLRNFVTHKRSHIAM